MLLQTSGAGLPVNCSAEAGIVTAAADHAAGGPARQAGAARLRFALPLTGEPC